MTLAHNNASIAQKWFQAFNTKDLNALLSLYDDNAQHYSPKLKARKPETNGLIQKKDALYQWWHDAFTRLPSLKYVPKKIVSDNDVVFMHYIRFVDHEDPMDICEILEIKNGAIVSSKVFHG